MALAKGAGVTTAAAAAAIEEAEADAEAPVFVAEAPAADAEVPVLVAGTNVDAGAQASGQIGVRAVRDLGATGVQAVADGAEAEGETDPDAEIETGKRGKFWCCCDVSLLKQQQQQRHQLQQ